MYGIKVLLCLILTVLIIIAERGVPAKLQKGDFMVYLILSVVLATIFINIS